ncbi:hypothetical protein ILYODFUR_007753 [Ilyodon furcidens]|uniref:Uncharacterized protein n=1 Tax=Ilyodon furcidens TaxID=33524 RepID=A0ABV0US70_9TELE
MKAGASMVPPWSSKDEQTMNMSTLWLRNAAQSLKTVIPLRVLSLPAPHSCFRARGFFLQSPDERAALSSPTEGTVAPVCEWIGVNHLLIADWGYLSLKLPALHRLSVNLQWFQTCLIQLSVLVLSILLTSGSKYL